ncbi:MAG: hypothetical protein CUN55_03985 [Phototrophicales bacterium]|nr:MAG: hypothetical protein CUN55_03985 [Phototrophicales bacterium]
MVNWYRNRRAQKLLEQAMNAAQKGQYAEAAHLASAALVLQPKNAEAYQQRAMWYHLAGQDDKALTDYEQAIQISPNNAALYLERGNLKRQQGDHEGAIADYSQAIRLDPNSPEAYHARYESHLAIDQLDKAIEDLSKAIQLAPRAEYFRQRAELYLLTGKRRQALADLERAVPSLESAYLQARAAASQQADTARNQDLLALVKEAYLAALVQRAAIRQQEGDLPDALADVQAALTIDADYAPAYNIRAKISQQNGDSGAVQDFLQAIKLDPSQAAYYLNLADLYFLAGAYQQARNVFEALQKQISDDPIAQMGMIICDYALGKRREAKASWQTLAEQDARLLNREQIQAIFSNHPNIAQVALKLI